MLKPPNSEYIITDRLLIIKEIIAYFSLRFHYKTVYITIFLIKSGGDMYYKT